MQKIVLALHYVTVAERSPPRVCSHRLGMHTYARAPCRQKKNAPSTTLEQLANKKTTQKHTRTHKHQIDKRKEEERRRRQLSFSMVTADAKRRPAVRTDEDYVLNYDDRFMSGRGPARRLRASWRAVSLAAVVMCNATSEATAQPKTRLLEWIRTTRPGLPDDLAVYVGMQLANLCRDKLLAAFRAPNPPGDVSLVCVACVCVCVFCLCVRVHIHTLRTYVSYIHTYIYS
jgi:hypothetical protein